MSVVYCHLMIPLVVNSILIKAGFTFNYTEEFLLIVRWIAALIAEICFISCVMLQQKIKQLLHDFSSFIESQRIQQEITNPIRKSAYDRTNPEIMFDYIAFICKQNSFKILFGYVSVFICKRNALRFHSVIYRICLWSTYR